VRSVGTIPNREESIRRLVKKLNEGGAWAACYEAGPTGYKEYKSGQERCYGRAKGETQPQAEDENYQKNLLTFLRQSSYQICRNTLAHLGGTCVCSVRKCSSPLSKSIQSWIAC